MSKENVKLFLQKVSEDVQLQQKVKGLYAENQENIQESIVKLGIENGYDFSKEDMQQLAQETAAALQQNGELDDAQLEAVAGGRGFGVGDLIFISIMSLGTACLASAVHESINEGCLLL